MRQLFNDDDESSDAPLPEGPIEEKRKNDQVFKPRLMRTGAAAVFAVIVFFGIGSGFQYLGDTLRSIFPGFNSPAIIQITSADAIIQSIQSHGTLLTTTVDFSGTFAVNSRYGMVCNVGANHQMYGSVQAGVDLMLLNADDIVIDEEAQALTIMLPAPSLIGCSVDPVRSYQYDKWGETLFCPMDEDKFRRFAGYLATNSFEADAISGGIFERAKVDATDAVDHVLTQMFSQYEDLSITIDFKPETTRVLPASCEPPIPEGYIYDARTGTWIEQ